MALGKFMDRWKRTLSIEEGTFSERSIRRNMNTVLFAKLEDLGIVAQRLHLDLQDLRWANFRHFINQLFKMWNGVVAHTKTSS